MITSSDNKNYSLMLPFTGCPTPAEDEETFGVLFEMGYTDAVKLSSGYYFNNGASSTIRNDGREY